MSDLHIDLSSVVAHVEQHVSAALEDEIVVLNMTDNKYYGLNGIGAFIWRTIEQPDKVSAVVEAVLDNYEVTRENCEEDVIAFVRELTEAGLIRVVT